MRQSRLFVKTAKTAPADEVSRNATFLVRAGFVHKEMAGVYSFLPLGLRVLNKINDVIREEMNSLGAQEVLLTALQDPEIWRQTDRWDQDVWFKTSLRVGGEIGFGWTQEEEITRIMSRYISSYRDLPTAVYQIQTKFRNEERAKSGLMRGREFLMKDLYSFHADQEDLDEFYERAIEAYRRIFEGVGIGEKTFLTFAGGGAFSKYSHEFQTVCETGEDKIFVSDRAGIAVNEEVFCDEVLADLKLAKEELREEKAVEVGNIFKLGTRFSEALGLKFTDREGRKKSVIMGCYGIGPSRLMGVVAEILSDQKGLVWPEQIAPFRVHLLDLNQNEKAAEVYDDLRKNGLEVLWDDRDLRAGEKFADSDLLGIPYRVVVSDKSLAAGGAELKRRDSEETVIVPLENLTKVLGAV